MDSDLYFLENSYLIKRRMQRKRREYWVSSILMKRKSLGEFNHLHEELKRNKEKFFDYYRMDMNTFQYILTAIHPSIKKWSNFRETIPPEERLALTLRYLATGSSFKTLGYSFRISDVSVGRIVKEVCEAIWDKLQALHMPFPKEDEVKNIVQEFWDTWKFPNCVGCIDGKHLRIKNPRHSGSMYRNYKHFFSIVLQAVAGPDYRFIAIEIGAYGKESDGGIFSHSCLSKKLQDGALGVGRLSTLPGTNIMVPYVLLGDEGYPLKTYLLRPFPVSSKIGPSQNIFNKRLSAARQVIECAFGIMSSKWRLLLTCIEIEEPDDIDKIVKCICLLHNIIIEKEGKELVATFNCHQTQSTNRYSSLGENRGVNATYSIRNKFMTFFSMEEEKKSQQI